MADNEAVQDPAQEVTPPAVESDQPTAVPTPTDTAVDATADNAPTSAPPTEAPEQPENQPAETPQDQTAQMAGNEPLTPQAEPLPSGETPPVAQPNANATPGAPQPVSMQAPSPAATGQSSGGPSLLQRSRELLAQANAMIQRRRQKKLDKILAEMATNGKITNDEVEKLLHVSDATATRYLSLLEKQGKIRQVGKTGKGVVYTLA